MYSHLTDPAVPVHLSYFLFAGLWAGFVGTAVIALIAIHCMRLLVESSHYLCHITGKETLDYGYCMDYAFKNVTGELIRKFLGEFELIWCSSSENGASFLSSPSRLSPSRRWRSENEENWSLDEKTGESLLTNYSIRVLLRVFRLHG